MKSRTRCLVLALALVLLAPALFPPHAMAGPPRPAKRPGRIWVRLKAGDQRALGQRARALSSGDPEVVIGELNGVVLRVPPGQEEQVARQLAARSDVAYAVTIPQAHIQQIPNDPGFSQQWALTRISAPAAWDAGICSSSMTIAILDSGVDLQHPDLAGVLWTNPAEVPGNGLDDDGNGKVDDVHGWHFYTAPAGEEYPALEDNDVQDDHGHGTHVAGIAAAATNNGVGVAGLAWGAAIMPVKVVDKAGDAYWDDVVKGILYAVDNGAKIINLSLGGSDPFPPLQEALAYARRQGVLTVAAAGNGSSNGTLAPVLYPAAYPEALAVAATDVNDRRVAFSNGGPQLSVAAPGAQVYSTYWQPKRDAQGNIVGDLHTYGYLSGTSMATPQVAALAALIWTRHPDLSVSQVEKVIELTADDVNRGTLPGWDEELGWGRINAARAVQQQMHWVQLPLVRSNP